MLTTKKTGWKDWKELDDPKVRLVQVRGTTPVKFIAEKLPKAQVLLLDNYPDAVRAIAQDRADGMVDVLDFLTEHTKTHKVEWMTVADACRRLLLRYRRRQGQRSAAREAQQCGQGAQRQRRHRQGVAEVVRRADAARSEGEPALERAGLTPPAAAHAPVRRGCRPVPAAARRDHGASPHVNLRPRFQRHLAAGALSPGGRLALAADRLSRVLRRHGHRALRRDGEDLRRRLVAPPVDAYVSFFTNTPQLVQIYFIFFALPEWGILLSPYAAVLIGMTLNAGAYLTQVQLAGFASVHRAEIEAAETLGFTRMQSVRFVILPHIMRRCFRRCRISTS